MSTKKRYFEHETVTSLRWYFGVLGFGGLYVGSTALWKAITISAPFTSASVGNICGLLWSLVVSAGFVYFTYTLPEYLRPNKVRILKSYIHILFGVDLALNVVKSITGISSFNWQMDIVADLFLVFIWWYLYQSIGRLSRGNG